MRFTTDAHGFAPAAIKLRTSTEDAWVPVSLQATTIRSNKDNLLGQGEQAAYKSELYAEGSIYRHHILFLVCLARLEETLYNQTLKEWGGNPGEEWRERFKKYPVEMETVHTKFDDFHPTNPLHLQANKKFSDPTPVVFPTDEPVRYEAALAELIESVRTAINNRAVNARTYTWGSYAPAQSAPPSILKEHDSR